MEQVNEYVAFDGIKAGKIKPFDGHLMILDGAITFEALGLKPFRDHVDGLGPASMAVVRVPGLGEFLLTLLDYNNQLPVWRDRRGLPRDANQGVARRLP